MVTVTLMASGVWTVKPETATSVAAFPVNVWMWNTCPAVMTSTVKSAGTPSAGSVEKNTLHACITSTLEKFCCTQTGSANVPSSPLMASVATAIGSDT